MHRILTIAVLAGMAAGACLLVAAPPRPSQVGLLPASRAFGQAVTAMGNLSQDIANPSPKLKEATDLRNQGMDSVSRR